MNDMTQLARAIVGGERKAASSEHLATVLKKSEDGTYWVRILGGAEETPITTPMVEASDGDTVHVSISGGRSIMTGNVTSPTATGRSVASVSLTAMTARQTANDAMDTAGLASKAALDAVDSAEVAAESAAYARASANKAIYALSDIENVVGTLNWIAEHGEYVLTSDTAIVEGKAYYTRSGTAPDYVYTLVTEPSASDLSTYYELEIDESVQNYLASHIYLLNDGLYVTTDSATGYKVRIDGDSVDVLDASGTVRATFGTTARIGTAAGQNIKIDSDSVDVCTGSTVDATISASGASFLQGKANITAFMEDSQFRGINLKSSNNNTYLRIVNGLEDGGGNPHNGVMLSELIAWGPSESIISATPSAIVNAANKAILTESDGTYYGMETPNWSTSAFIRTTSSGIIPYKSGGSSALGTTSWPFNNVFSRTISTSHASLKQSTAPSAETYHQASHIYDADGNEIGHDEYSLSTARAITHNFAAVRQKKDDSTWTWYQCKMTVAVNGTVSYSISSPAAFRSAIGCGNWADNSTTVLYNNATGVNGTVTLSASAANYNHLRIFYREQNSIYHSSDFYSPNNRKISLICCNSDSSASSWKTKVMTISGTSITVVSGATYRCNITNSSVSRSTDNDIYIWRVEGWNE